MALRPMIVTYNNVINACAYADDPNDDPEDILRIALETLDEAQETCEPNYITYGTCLRAITNLKKDRVERWRLIRKLFRKCCDEGQLSNSIMRQLKSSLSPTQYAVLQSEATDERTGRLREECTKKARLLKMAPPTRVAKR